MKKTLTIILLLVVTLCTYAQEQRRKFSKDQFKAELQAYIIQEAELSPDEAVAFFSIFNEMKSKQRDLFVQMRDIDKTKADTDEAYAEAIKKHDKLDIEVKELQQSYNLRLLKVVPAKKLFKALKAEDKFHRKSLRKFNNNNGPKPKKRR